VYRAWFEQFGNCKEEYVILSDLLQRFQLWQTSEGFKVPLSPGTTKEKLQEAAKKIENASNLPFEWPKDLICWYLLVNGQPSGSPGFFGGYSFYNVSIDLCLLSVEQIVQFAQSKPQVSRELLPIALSTGYQKVYFIVRNPKIAGQKLERNQIVCFGEQTLFPIADNFVALVYDHIVNLESKNFIVRETQINLFPQKNLASAVTNNVKISASPLFIPERSSSERFLWAYSIKMEMDKDVPKNIFDCQLSRRHWDITSEGHTETVDGDGVIGYYPEMLPGKSFVYESCCPLDANNGTMGGFFVMKKKMVRISVRLYQLSR